jgi:hypothetical protein
LNLDQMKSVNRIRSIPERTTKLSSEANSTTL